jgi:prevent-host-death family protein
MVMRILPLTEVKAKLSEVVDEITETQERVTVTRNGRPAVVMLSADDLESIEETLEILSDPWLRQQIEEGLADLAAGRVVKRDDLMALRNRLGSEPE